MKFQSWISASSSSVNTAADHPIPPPKRVFPDDASNFSDLPSSSPSLFSQETNSLSSLQSNLSLLTLPSLPSLQNLSPGTLNLAISASCLNSLNPRNAHVTFLAMHNNLLYAASSNEINVFELTNFTLIDTFNNKDPSSGSAKSITFLDGKIFTAHQDCKIRVWKLTSIKQHKLIATLPTLEDRLRRFVFPSNYSNVRRHKKKMWIEHHDAVSGLAVNENLMCSVSWDRCLKIWGGSNLRCKESIRAHDDAINAVVVGKDGTIFTGSADKRIRVWGKPYGEKKVKIGLIATLEKHKSAVNALALSSDESVLFSGACDRSILVWEREDSANYMVVTGALRGHTKAILCLINVSDLLFSGSADQTVRIWTRGNQGQFCCLTVLDGHRTPVRSLVTTAVATESGGADGGVKLFSGSFDGEIKVWQIMVSSTSGSPLIS